MLKIKDYTIKPSLTNSIKLDVFLNFYWLKKELSDFCTTYSLATNGTKEELIERIKIFLTTGNTTSIKIKFNTSIRDSDNAITVDTKVVNYRNDAATRKFFVEQIGSSFHFNSYLRQFTSDLFKGKEDLTYGDLVEGCKKSETIKKDPNYKTKIGKQFEYNQFIRDFFSNEKGKTRREAIDAWKFIKNQPGKRDYQHYKILKND